MERKSRSGPKARKAAGRKTEGTISWQSTKTAERHAGGTPQPRSAMAGRILQISRRHQSDCSPQHEQTGEMNDHNVEKATRSYGMKHHGKSTSNAGQPGQGCKLPPQILVVDDDSALLDTYVESLSDTYRIVKAETGRVAIE